MAKFESPSTSDFAELVNEYIHSEAGQEDVNEQGFGEMSRAQVAEIGERFAIDVEAAYSSVLIRGVVNQKYPLHSTYYWRPVDVDIKVSMSKKYGTATIVISYPDDLLFRPSLEKWKWGFNTYMQEYKHKGRWKRTLVSQRMREGTGEHTGPGIRDIFALVTQGYHRIRHPVSGIWHDNPNDESGGRITYALPQRTGTPFVPGVVAKYKQMYPNVTIVYPPEWG